MHKIFRAYEWVMKSIYLTNTVTAVSIEKARAAAAGIKKSINC